MSEMTIVAAGNITRKGRRFFNLTGLKEIGITKAIADKYLPEPIRVCNPYYRSSAPMKLWPEEVVIHVLEQDEVKRALIKANERSERGKNSAAKKASDLVDEVEKLAKTMPIYQMSYDEVRERALESKQAWYDYQYNLREDRINRRTVEGADEVTIARWIENYIRHELTDYDMVLYHLKGKVGVKEAHDMLQKILHERIYSMNY